MNMTEVEYKDPTTTLAHMIHEDRLDRCSQPVEPVSTTCRPYRSDRSAQNRKAARSAPSVQLNKILA